MPGSPDELWMLGASTLGTPDVAGPQPEPKGCKLSQHPREFAREVGDAVDERVSWEVCPGCGRTAAVGWIDDRPVEFDCTAGCQLTAAQIRAFTHRRRPTSNWLTRP
jgi:hypothetical protein